MAVAADGERFVVRGPDVYLVVVELAQQVGMARSLPELYEIAVERGYQRGWIYYRYKSKVQKEYDACKGDKNKLVKFQNYWELMQWDTISKQALERAITKKYNTFMSLKNKLK